MTKNEAIMILETAKGTYPQMKTSEVAVKIWINQLMKMDYKQVNARLMQHITTSKYPPTIAEVAVFRDTHNDRIEKTKLWAEEARKVPIEKKREFIKMLNELSKKVGDKQ